jgi:hypothetical protein
LAPLDTRDLDLFAPIVEAYPDTRLAARSMLEARYDAARARAPIAQGREKDDLGRETKAEMGSRRGMLEEGIASIVIAARKVPGIEDDNVRRARQSVQLVCIDAIGHLIVEVEGGHAQRSELLEIEAAI